MRLVDTHCHLNLSDHFPNPSQAIERARDAGVERLIVVGIDLLTSRTAVDLSDKHEGVFATVGIHPNSSHGFTSGDLNQLEEMLQETKVVALGEIGLDYHWDHATKAEQLTALEAQLDLARRHDVPVVFHCREAYPDLLDLLSQSVGGKWLLHCFAGSAGDAKRAVELGCWFGVDGPITYPKADELRAIVSSLPPDRLVVETDAPFLTPVPFRGKPNEPAYVRHVNAGLAVCLGIGELECAEMTARNAETYFRLPS